MYSSTYWADLHVLIQEYSWSSDQKTNALELIIHVFLLIYPTHKYAHKFWSNYKVHPRVKHNLNNNSVKKTYSLSLNCQLQPDNLQIYNQYTVERIESSNMHNKINNRIHKLQ